MSSLCKYSAYTPINKSSTGRVLLDFRFQVYDPEEVGEEVVELTVIQRQLQPRIPVSFHCAGCSKESPDLRACTKCRTAAYCDV